MTAGPALDRRRFLTGSAGVAAAAALAGCRDGGSGAAMEAGAGGAAGTAGERYLPFRGRRQTGISAEHQSSGLMAAFDLVAGDRAQLAETLRALSAEVERIMTGQPYDEREPAYPPLYTGTVGNPPPPAGLSVVVSLGASVFDGRYGLAALKPAELVAMPILANDRLDPARTHGDVLLSIASNHTDHDLFALRQLMRATRATLSLRWMTEGFNRRTEARPGQAGVRNLMGFVDGTANLDRTRLELLDRYVFVGAGDAEPAWAVGGSYQVVRLIRMLVEFWDRTRLSEQERLIGRRKHDGAPLDGALETDLPDFAGDPDGQRTPLDSHIRLANPRTPEVADQQILRKGFNYSRGFDDAGQLDQGLAFVSYQRSIVRQFLPIARRLDGEPLEEYLVPEGGGYFFALPGATDAGGDYLGRALVES